MTHISGKVILLTCASRGIGPFIAEALATRGWLFALNEGSPELGDWFMRALGVAAFQRKKAGG